MVAQLDRSHSSHLAARNATQHVRQRAKIALTKQQQQEAASILAQAFDRYPFMAYVLPNAKTRIPKLANLFLPLVRSSYRHGRVNITPGGGGVLVWVPGKVFSNRVKFLDLFQSGMLTVPFSLGPSAFNRFTVHDEVCEEALLQYARRHRMLRQDTSQDFAYIWAVGVHPNHAGKGVGSTMVRTALNEMSRQGYSTCWLRTETPKNVALYERLGFQQVHTEIPAASGQQYWLMSQDL
ncbi:MAG: GNAT family N-acetyltransferase [Cyanobacteria bacterium P01_F01_bin.3]